MPLTIEVTGDTARAVSCYAFLKGTAIATAGTYRDELARTAEGWQITRRDITPG